MSEERFDKLEESLLRIENALIGDEKMGSIGFIQRLKDVEKKTARHGKIIMWISMGWTMFAGTCLYFKTQIAESIVNKIH